MSPFYRWYVFEKEVYCHTWEVYGALLIEERRVDASYVSTINHKITCNLSSIQTPALPLIWECFYLKIELSCIILYVTNASKLGLRGRPIQV